MSAVESLIDIPPFRRAVSALVEVTRTHPVEELRSLLASDMTRPMLRDAEQTSEVDEARRAFATLYELAEGTSVAEVLQDLEQGEFDLGEVRPKLDDILQPSSEISDRVDGRRQRDMFLPNLNEVRLSADFRVVSVSSGDLLAPVITARMVFDEPVAGSSAVTFQIAVDQVDDLVKLLTDTKRISQRLSHQTDALKVAQWAQDSTA